MNLRNQVIKDMKLLINTTNSINALKSIYMATKVITVPAGTTKFKAYPDKREVKRQLTNWPRLCMHCKSWEGNHTTENRCQKYTKTIRIKPIKSTCVKFQPQVEKELLRLGIKHALLAEMKRQGLLASRLKLILEDKSTYLVINRAFLWQNAKSPINGNTGYKHWQSLATKCRN